MNNDIELEGDTALPKTIDLYGLFGAFRIEKSPYLIRYASTFANPSRTNGHGELVDELKPMRDRVKPSDLRDLRSLLQRDLSDKRVASELVPYLKGLTQSGIGFFPAILAVIVPKDYLLDQNHRPTYPKPTPKDGGRIDYDDCWSIEHYKVKGQQLPMGRIKIVASKTDIIVLDGQHRASAFRYASGKFKPEGTIYQTFYSKLGAGSGLAADLPVTLIWFEGDNGADINPMLISRKLFVDVNNTAKPVSLARTYLLDDRRVSCIGTQEFYNHAAARSYQPQPFSLLHSAFDMDTDLAKAPVPCFTLTTPEIIEAALQFAFLGGQFDALGRWRIERLRRQTNISRFKNIWPLFQGIQTVGTEDEDEGFVGISDPQQGEEFRKLLRESYQPILVSLFDRFQLLRPHYEACAKTAEWVQKESSTTVQEVWDKVFCGGEGLYWALRDPGDSDRARNYRDGIKEIESRFFAERAALFGEGDTVNQVYTSFVSKAFQIGFVMAIDYLASVGDGERLTKVDSLLGGLNSYSNANWGAVFTELWPVIRPSSSTDPKAWPAYRNILLRMYDNSAMNLYSTENLDESPDWRLCEILLNRAASAIFDASGAAPTDTERKRRAKNEVDTAIGILQQCGLTPIWGENKQSIVKKADKALDKKFQDLLKTTG